jgi:hypothetical protein
VKKASPSPSRAQSLRAFRRASNEGDAAAKVCRLAKRRPILAYWRANAFKRRRVAARRLTACAEIVDRSSFLLRFRRRVLVESPLHRKRETDDHTNQLERNVVKLTAHILERLFVFHINPFNIESRDPSPSQTPLNYGQSRKSGIAWIFKILSVFAQGPSSKVK